MRSAQRGACFRRVGTKVDRPTASVGVVDRKTSSVHGPVAAAVPSLDTSHVTFSVSPKRATKGDDTELTTRSGNDTVNVAW